MATIPAAPVPVDYATMWRDYAESQNPELKAKRLAQEKAAALAARPYEVRLAEAKAAQAAANQALADFKQPEAKTPLEAMSLGLSKQPVLAAKAAADKAVNQVIQGHVADQLNKQAGAYGFGWEGNKSAEYHSGKVAELLVGQGITDLTQLGYSKDKKYLINKETGKQLNWHKGTTGQLGWSAKGKGRTNYMVQPDAAGNPVLYPKWKSNAPGGIGGFLLKAAPAIVGIATGNPLLGAATGAGIGALGGQDVGDIIKGAAVNIGGGYLGNVAGNLAGEAVSGAGLGSVGSGIASGAASNATRAITSGLATGDLSLDDILKAAAVGGVTGGVTTALKPEALPTGQAGPPAPPTAYTGIEAVDKLIPGAAGAVAGKVTGGQDLVSALEQVGAGAATNLATGVVRDVLPTSITGNETIDNALLALTQGGVKTGTSELLNDLLATSPSKPSAPAPAPAPVAIAPTPAPVVAAPVPAPAPLEASAPAPAPAAGSTNGISNNYLAMFPLLAASMMGQQAAPAPQQQLAQLGNKLDLNKLFGGQSLYAEGGPVGANESMQQLLAILRASGKIA